MKKLIIIVLVFVLTISNSACSNKQTVENSSSEQASAPIESNNSELTNTSKSINTSETSSRANVTSSKSAVTSRETTTTSKAKTETSSEKVSTSSKNVWVKEETDIGDFEFNFSSSNIGQSTNGGTAKYMYAEEMCNDPELKAQIEQLNETYKDLGMHISLEGNGEKLTIVYKFLTQVDGKAIEGELKEALKSQKHVFNSQVAQMQTEVMTEMVLGIKFVNADGTTICEEEYPQ